MPLTVGWNGGVYVNYHGRKLLFDSRKNNHSQIFITHAHLDHSKGFSYKDSRTVSTKQTRELAAVYGQNVVNWNLLPVGGRMRVEELEVVSHNAGHVLGSSFFEILTPEGNIVYTGDLQVKDSFTLKGAEPILCDVLIIESTFGSEVFHFPERENLARDMVQWAYQKIREGKTPVFKADSLGNAQEVNKIFNLYSELPVTVHWRVAQINRVYTANGQHLVFHEASSKEASEVASTREHVFITHKNVNLKSHPEYEPALVSGWAVWARRDKHAFPLSDHADFNQLMSFVEKCNPKAVLTCFGGKFNASFAKQIRRKLGIEARPLNLISTQFVL